jgi:hypothetical protein
MTPCITIFHNTTTDTTTWSRKVVEAVAIAKGSQETLGTTFTAPNEQVPDLDVQEEYDEIPVMDLILRHLQRTLNSPSLLHWEICNQVNVYFLLVISCYWLVQTATVLTQGGRWRRHPRPLRIDHPREAHATSEDETEAQASPASGRRLRFNRRHEHWRVCYTCQTRRRLLLIL